MLLARVLRIVFLNGMIGPPIVLVLVDFSADLVLLMVYLGVLQRCQMASVGGAVLMDFVMDLRLLVFQMPGLARSQLPGPHAVGDAILLIGLARADSAHRRAAMIFRRKVSAVHASRMLV